MRKVDSFVDLECGKVLSEDEIKDLHSKKKFDRKRSGVGVLNGFTKDGDKVSTSKIVLISGENAEILMGGKQDEAAGIAKKKNVNGKCKKSKPPKPPRPPGAPLLDEADMKLVKEISELARLKHARKERIKAMKNKRRLHKASSSTSIYATMVTFIFCVIIIYQGAVGVLNSEGPSHEACRMWQNCTIWFCQKNKIAVKG